MSAHAGCLGRALVAALVVCVGALTAQQPTGVAPSRPAFKGADEVVYGDALASGWYDWSWGSTVDLAVPAPALGSGGRSVGVTYDGAWAGLYFHADTALDVTPGATLRYFVHGGNVGGQALVISAFDAAFQPGAVIAVAPPAAGGWEMRSVPLSAFGLDSLGGLVWQEASGGAQPRWYLDQLRVVRRIGAEPYEPGHVASGPALTVDGTVAGTPISERIYGTNALDALLAIELAVPLRRFGGNHITRYNWQLDVSNRAADWYFENIPYPNAALGLLPTGSTSDQWVEQDQATGARTVLTVPLIGWTPRSREIDGGFRVSKYGPQLDVDPYQPDLGNGVTPGGAWVVGNDPLDTSIPVGEPFVAQWVQHLVSRFGTAAQGGVAYYALDNEPMLWNATHRDVHPASTTYDEVVDLGVSYATAIKGVDPSAQVVGPCAWGWTAYFWSALDQEAGGTWWLSPVDQLAHGGVPFLEWYLQQMQLAEVTEGKRLLDVLDVHFYPEAPGVYAGALDATTKAVRLRSTRALWDPTYVDESWIAQPVQLIPRLRQMVARLYPGTEVSLGEYSFGALDDMNGALAQADALGIFGREGLDAAMLWALLEPEDPGTFAFRMYRNYDGMGARFGTAALPAQSADHEAVSVYAARRSDGALTVMLLNKGDNPLACDLSVQGVSLTSDAEHWSYGPQTPQAIVRQPDVKAAAFGGGVTLRPKLQATSIHLLVLR